MADRSHLVPHQILDSVGRRTIVYRKPGTPLPSRGQIPPAIVAPALGVQQPPVGDVDSALRDRAAECVALFHEASQIHPDHRTRPHLMRAVENCFWGKRPRYGALITAAQYGPVYRAIDRYSTFADTQAFAREAELEPTDLVAYDCTLAVANTLIKLRLMKRDEVPDEDNNLRFLAHLSADRWGILDYSSPEDDEDRIRLIDQYPDRVDEIHRLSSMPTAKLEVMLRDGIASPLASGAL